MPVIRDRERGLILLSRLEAATSLLESIVAPNLGDASAPTNGTAPNDEAGLAPGSRTDQARGMTTSPQPIPEPLPPAIEDFDTIIAEDVQAFANMSEEIGGLVAEQVRLPRCRKHLSSVLTSLLLVSCRTPSVCGRTKIPYRLYQSKEAR